MTADDEQLRDVLREVASTPPPAARFPLGHQIRTGWRRVLFITAAVTVVVLIGLLLLV